MHLYLLTNKVTHARAVVLAANPEDAVRVHPTDDLAHRRADDRGWERYTATSYTGKRIPPPVGWPAATRLIHADLIGRAEGEYRSGSCALPIAYQESLVLRVGGERPEGPDASWGGYTLDALSEV